jgi:hypothetical protein
MEGGNGRKVGGREGLIDVLIDRKKKERRTR